MGYLSLYQGPCLGIHRWGVGDDLDIVLGMRAFKNVHVVLSSLKLLSFNLFTKVGFLLRHDAIHLCLQGKLE